MAKKTYHPLIYICYKNGLLPKEFLKDIAPSTLCVWRNTDYSKYYGWQYVAEIEHKLNAMGKVKVQESIEKKASVLTLLVSLLSFFLSKSINRRNILRKYKSEIIEVVENSRKQLKLLQIVSLFRISVSTYYGWRNNLECRKDKELFCRRHFYNQLTWQEVEVIQAYMQNPNFEWWSTSSIYCQMIRDKSAFMCLTTFYKYVNELGLKREPVKKRKSEKIKGIRASGICEVLHIDVTQFFTSNNTRVYIYLLIDNYSRYILSGRAELSCKSAWTVVNLKEAFEKHGLYCGDDTINLITDGGSENFGSVSEFINSGSVNMRRVIALKDIRYSNSMIESVNKKIKNDFLNNYKIIDYDELKLFLKKVICEYNSKPLYVLGGHTPEEVFYGACPDRDMFASLINRSEINRRQVNKNCNHCGRL